jgi:hypothetical protein
MTQRTDSLRKDLNGLLKEWSFGDEGRVLIAPTKADLKAVSDAVDAMPDSQFLTEFAVLAASLVSEHVVQTGKRPADYWKNDDIPKSLARRLGKALQGDSESFVSAFKAALKGGG